MPIKPPSGRVLPFIDSIRMRDLNFFLSQMSIQELTDRFGQCAQFDDGTKSFVSR